MFVRCMGKAARGFDLQGYPTYHAHDWQGCGWWLQLVYRHSGRLVTTAKKWGGSRLLMVALPLVSYWLHTLLASAN